MTAPDGGQTRPDVVTSSDASLVDAQFVQDSSYPDVGMKDAMSSVPDQGFIDASTSPFIEVGTGDQSFVPINQGDALPFILGPQGGGSQGGYHLWMAVRSQGFDPVDASLSVYLIQPNDQMNLVSMSRPIRLQDTGDYYGIAGIRIVPPDCCALVDSPLIFRVEIIDRAGKTGSAEAMFLGGDRCPDIDNNNICP